MNLSRSPVASSSRTGRKRHRRSRRGFGRGSRVAPRLLGSAMSVVPEEPVAVGRCVEISLDRPESPSPTPPPRRRVALIEVAAVESWMLLHLAPDSERGPVRHLREGGRLRPTSELGHRHQLRASLKHFPIVDLRGCWTGIDGYKRLRGFRFKATPWDWFGRWQCRSR